MKRNGGDGPAACKEAQAAFPDADEVKEWLGNLLLERAHAGMSNQEYPAHPEGWYAKRDRSYEKSGRKHAKLTGMTDYHQQDPATGEQYCVADLDSAKPLFGDTINHRRCDLPRLIGMEIHQLSEEAGLTAKQRQVLLMFGRGLSADEIAHRWKRHRSTIEEHLTAGLAKLEDCPSFGFWEVIYGAFGMDGVNTLLYFRANTPQKCREKHVLTIEGKKQVTSPSVAPSVDSCSEVAA